MMKCAVHAKDIVNAFGIMIKKYSSDLHWNGCWEIRPGRTICRAMIVWSHMGRDLYGCVAGYSGGGAFQLEKFWLEDGEVRIEARSALSAWPDTGLQIAEDSQDVVMSFHDREIWEDSENLRLLPTKVRALKNDGDLLFGGESIPETLIQIFNDIGLTWAPKYKQHWHDEKLENAAESPHNLSRSGRS